MSRTDILRGPAIIQYQAQTFYSQGDITVTLGQETFAVNVANFGKVDDRVDQVMHQISFTPAGQWAALGVLFPYASALIGSSVFGADKTITIWTIDGKKRVYKAGAVTKMPNIMLAATKTLFGDVQFTCLHAEASAWADANSLFTDSAEAYPGDAAFNAAQIITQPYTCAWGGDAPWDAFQTKEGIAVEFNLQLNPETNDHKGLFDYTFQSLDVSAKLIPEGVTPAQVLALLKHQGAGAVRGRSTATTNKLKIAGTGVFVSLSGTAPILGNEAYGPSVRRVGQMEFRATRTFTGGVVDPLFVVGTEDPDEEA
ncbi:hypothetical protein [Verrucomicrobium spinosum]|uniref:hypothetical protein n=1 Tax=Verrucomicrobium spinosum TaxID=2736 RepID=UPI0009D712A3|nr:hypothetical protein [Verrucomicrobium spinosum]